MADWARVLVRPDAKIIDVIRIVDASTLQVALVADERRRLLGLVTDGDVRRGLLRGVPLEGPVREVMNAGPTVARLGDSRTQVLRVMQQKRLHQVPVVDDDGVVIGLHLIDELVAMQQRDNWVVLQAGGMGTRLRPLTDDCPKPLLSVGSKPILESILENFIEYGFRRFFISVRYKAEMVERHFGDGERWNVRIEYLEEEEPLGTAGGLSLLPGQPAAPVVVMNGDLLTQINFRQLLDFHAENRAAATMAVREYDFQVPYGVVKLDDEKLVGVDEKPVKRFFINAGVYVLEARVISMIDAGERLDMTDLFRRVIDRGEQTVVFPIREYWLDIGRVDDFERAQRELPGLLGYTAGGAPAG